MKYKKSKESFVSNAQRARNAMKTKRESDNNQTEVADDVMEKDSEETSEASSRKRVMIDEDDDDEGNKKSRFSSSPHFDNSDIPNIVDHDIFDFSDSHEVFHGYDSSETFDAIKEERDRMRVEMEIFSEDFCSTREEINIKTIQIEQLERRNFVIIRRIRCVRSSRNEYKKRFHNLKKRFLKFLHTKNNSQPESSKSHHTFPIPYSLLKNHNSKKHRFKKTLNHLQSISQEEDVESYMVDFGKFLDKDANQSYRSKLTLLQTCSLKTKACLSRYQLDAIKKCIIKHLGHDFLPSIKSVCLLAKETSMISLFKTSQIPREDSKLTTVVQCTDVKALLEWRLQKLAESNQLKFDRSEEVVIAIGGDCGGGTTKINLIISNVDQPNSISHISTIGIFDDSDDHDNIRRYLQPLLDQLNNLESVDYEEKGTMVIRKVHQKFVADFKLLSEALCHMKQRSKHFCIYCEEENPGGDHQRKLKDLDLTRKCKSRTLETYRKYSKTGAMSVKKNSTPLFERIEVTDYLIPMLHCATGLFLKYIFWNLWKHCVDEDNFTSFEIFPNKEKTETSANSILTTLKCKIDQEKNRKKKEMLKRELEKKIEEREELSVILEGLPGGKLVQLERKWESLGATRRAFFQTFTGNHVKKILTDEGVIATFSVFSTPLDPTLTNLQNAMKQLSRIMTLSANIYLSDKDLEQLEEARNQFATCLQQAYPEETITQKLHTMLFHMVDLAKKERTLGHLSEQGIEATHAYFNKLERRFCSFHSKPIRFHYVARELLCTNMVNDLEGPESSSVQDSI